MDKLEDVYTIKGAGFPEYYLGGDVEQLDEHWSKEHISIAFSGQTYTKTVITHFEALFNLTFDGVITPMANNYHNEIDGTPICSPTDAARF